MSELQIITNHLSSSNNNNNTATATTNAIAAVAVADKIELPTFDLPQNYSILINKLEQLALGLESTFGNLSLDRKEVEIAVSGTTTSGDGGTPLLDILGAPIAAGRAPPPHANHAHGMGDVEYSRVVSDIWIGVILTLLIVSVIFFICSCFLYHKFQQWKNSYRTNPNEPVEICRRYPPDFEAESLPSYTIVSGLPTYDDALEEFRKAGIILTPPMPVIKIFENDAKDSQIYNLENGLNDINGSDNISLSSTCTCGANSGNGNGTTILSATNSNLLTSNNNLSVTNAMPSQVIELTPEQLATLSQKRLSLQIAFNNSIRRSSRARVDLCREVNRNNMLRSRAAGTNTIVDSGFPVLHRSSSSGSLCSEIDRRLQHLQHRGSLC